MCRGRVLVSLLWAVQTQLLGHQTAHTGHRVLSPQPSDLTQPRPVSFSCSMPTEGAQQVKGHPSVSTVSGGREATSWRVSSALECSGLAVGWALPLSEPSSARCPQEVAETQACHSGIRATQCWEQYGGGRRHSPGPGVGAPGSCGVRSGQGRASGWPWDSHTVYFVCTACGSVHGTQLGWRCDVLQSLR